MATPAGDPSPPSPSPTLVVAKANNLPQKDGTFTGKSDPYVKVFYYDGRVTGGDVNEEVQQQPANKHFYQTKVIQDKLNPVWNEECPLENSPQEVVEKREASSRNAAGGKNTRLRLEVWESDGGLAGADDFVGEVADVKVQNGEFTFPLNPKPNNSNLTAAERVDMGTITILFKNVHEEEERDGFAGEQEEEEEEGTKSAKKEMLLLKLQSLGRMRLAIDEVELQRELDAEERRKEEEATMKNKTKKSDAELLAEWREREGRVQFEDISKRHQHNSPSSSLSGSQRRNHTNSSSKIQRNQRQHLSPQTAGQPRKRRPSEATMALYPASSNKRLSQGEEDRKEESASAEEGDVSLLFLEKAKTRQNELSKITKASTKKSRGDTQPQESLLIRSGVAVSRDRYFSKKLKHEADSLKQIKEEFRQKAAYGKLELTRQQLDRAKKQTHAEKIAIVANPLQKDQSLLKPIIATSAISGETVVLDVPRPFAISSVKLPPVSRNQRLLYEQPDPSTFTTPMPTSSLSNSRALIIPPEGTSDGGGDGGDRNHHRLLLDCGETRSTSSLAMSQSANSSVVDGGTRMTQRERRARSQLASYPPRPAQLPDLKRVNHVVDNICGPALSRTKQSFGNQPGYWDRLNLYNNYTQAVKKKR